MPKKIIEIIRLIRPEHIIKNALIFVPLFFGHALLKVECLSNAILGFAVFSLMASSVYVFNDLRDVESDRVHPKKSKRPIASGAVCISTARVIIGILIVSSIIISAISGLLQYYWYLAIYWLLNIAYSMGLKNKPIIDVVILASGFVIRMVYGAAITHIPVSGWLYITVFSGACFFALGKRRKELVIGANRKDTRKVLKYYKKEFLDRNMYVFMGMANVFYSLWAVDQANNKMVGTVPLIMIIMLRYSYDIESGEEGDPIEVVLGDRILMYICLLYIICLAILMYGDGMSAK